MSVNVNLEFNTIRQILEQAPEAKLSEELEKHHLTTKIVLKQLTQELRDGNRSLTPDFFGKAMSLITPAQETKAWVGDFVSEMFNPVSNNSVSNKSEFLEIMRKCIILNERVATIVLIWASRFNKIDPSDLKQLRDVTAGQGVSTKWLYAVIFSRITSFIERDKEDEAIHFIDQFPEFSNEDIKDDNGKPLVLLAIENDCHKVVDHLLDMNSANSGAIDHFGANIADYAFAYKMYDVLDRINPVPVSTIEEAKWLANVWSLGGVTAFGDIDAELEGFYGNDTTRIARSALSYLHWKQTKSEQSDESHPLRKMNFTVMVKTLIGLYRKEDPLALIKKKMPTIVMPRWEGHAAYVLFGRKHRIMKCNRGEDCGVSGVRIFKMPEWNDNMLPLTFNSLKITDKFMNSSDFDQWLYLSHSKDIVQKEQPIGNCPSESGKAAINALFIDEALETYPDEETALEKAKLVYKDYTVFMRMKALEDYLERSRRHYDISLLNRIKEKIIDLEKRKPLWAGQTAKLLDLFKKHNISC